MPSSTGCRSVATSQLGANTRRDQPTGANAVGTSELGADAVVDWVQTPSGRANWVQCRRERRSTHPGAHGVAHRRCRCQTAPTGCKRRRRKSSTGCRCRRRTTFDAPGCIRVDAPPAESHDRATGCKRRRQSRQLVQTRRRTGANAVGTSELGADAVGERRSTHPVHPASARRRASTLAAPPPQRTRAHESRGPRCAPRCARRA